MVRHNRCNVKIAELLQAWENQIDDDMVPWRILFTGADDADGKPPVA